MSYLLNCVNCYLERWIGVQYGGGRPTSFYFILFFFLGGKMASNWGCALSSNAPYSRINTVYTESIRRVCEHRGINCPRPKKNVDPTDLPIYHARLSRTHLAIMYPPKSQVETVSLRFRVVGSSSRPIPDLSIIHRCIVWGPS